MSDDGILSRNFYWLPLPGGDYKLLEQYREKKIPLTITSLTFIKGSSYEIRMHIQNTSKAPDSRSLLPSNNFIQESRNQDFDMSSLEAHAPEKVYRVIKTRS
ncbi:Mannosylglycoprotein endo-beta-mannosidase [Abeliophyllum distichum]|uniref:Mannosylglycoprotein endo-beta-mannosidase n=1 Tax=Abeliophyllum distichum TaxID=126358 RepID=A0ABD1P9J2_9LAMI